ncbi:MAG: protein translocase subunit SecF [Blastocatellia bacterium]|nr:protein translocase subunit SecF [Blastocatellia bacterium]
MIEIFKNANYDFLSKKWIFIGVSWVLILLGVGSMLYRAFDGKDNTHPFNMGVDFAGGTMATVKFNARPDLEKIRSEIARQGIEAPKITLQPVGDEIGQAPKNEVLVRLPNLEQAPGQAGASDADLGKQKILAALGGLNPPDAKGKVDLNTIGRDVLRSELQARGGLDSQRADEVAGLIVDYREKAGAGLINDFNAVKSLRDSEGKTVAERTGDALDRNFFAGAAAVKSAEAVSPQVGSELRNRAIWVTVLSCLGMLVFVAFRFKSWGFGIGAIIAVFHDVLVTLGIFSITQWEINLTVIAALLTLVGYSMNDTIVIFDRIREMLRTKRREGLEKLSNDAINQTLSRTIITSGLTFLTVIAMLVFGGEVLRSFSWALFIGIIIGTYSSIYIASPFMLWWEGWRAQTRAAAAAPQAAAKESAAGASATSDAVTAAGVTPSMLAAAGVSIKPRKKGK